MAGRSIHLFRSTHEYQHAMGIYSLEPNQRRSFNSRNFFFLICFLQLLVPTFSFFVFKATTFKEYGDSFYATTTSISSPSYYLVQMLHKQNFERLTKEFEDFVEQKVSKRIRHYEKLSKSTEFISKLLQFGCSRLTVMGVVLPQLLLTLINYFVYDLGEDSYYLPFPVMLPFDWKTPFGYLLAIWAQAAGFFCICYNAPPVIGFMIGSCWLFISFIEDITTEFQSLSAIETLSSNRNDKEIKKTFCNIIQLYSDVKQLIELFNEIFEFIILIFFAWAIVTMCCTLLLLQSEFSNIMDPNANPIDFISVVQSVSMVFWSFSFVLFFCESGEMVTNQFNRFHEELCQSNWYLYPLEIQQLYLIFITNTQRPAIIYGFGNIQCTRDVFKKTNKTGFSYFMLVRQMNG